MPPTDASLAWLRNSPDPSAALFVAVEVDGRDRESCGALIDAVVQSDGVQALLAAQRPDGSWGPQHGRGRADVLATLHTLQTLATFGVGPHRATSRAISFLADAAHTADGVFSIDGGHEGVLSCYVGTAASTYQLCGELDLARRQIDWILRHQDVARGGVRVRGDKPEHWGEYLRTRYGGCMSNTTCLVGLVKTGRALQLYSDGTGDRRVELLRAAIREAFLDRELMYDRSGKVVPLGVAPKKAAEWLVPTFPLDWHTDLIETLDVVARTGPYDRRMQSAIGAVSGWRLADGSWPLRRSFWPADAVRERRSLKRGHPIVTMRAVSVLRACHAAPRASHEADS